MPAVFASPKSSVIFLQIDDRFFLMQMFPMQSVFCNFRLLGGFFPRLLFTITGNSLLFFVLIVMLAAQVNVDNPIAGQGYKLTWRSGILVSISSSIIVTCQGHSLLKLVPSQRSILDCNFKSEGRLHSLIPSKHVYIRPYRDNGPRRCL